MHIPDSAFQACRHGLVGQGATEYRGEDFMDVGEPLNGIGEGLFVDLRVLGADAVADGAIVDRGKFQNSW